MIARDDNTVGHMFDDVCEHCGRSLVSRFSDEPALGCQSCDDDMLRGEQAAFWGSEAA